MCRQRRVGGGAFDAREQRFVICFVAARVADFGLEQRPIFFEPQGHSRAAQVNLHQRDLFAAPILL